jgi:hypothetical protein
MGPGASPGRRRMIAKMAHLFGLVLGSYAVMPALAQQGHPLVGSWHGTWGMSGKDRHDVTLIINYDGKSVTGILNPGLDASKLEKASLDPAGWTVHLEADEKDRSGKLVHVVIEGKIENITSVRRSITGTWTEGNVKSDFKIIRDN